MPYLTKQRNGAKEETARVSSTDPDARVMKMSDHGFRPAFNVPFATTTDRARVIVGVDAKAHRGLDHFVVRGLPKVLGTASLFARTYNVLRLITLRG